MPQWIVTTTTVATNSDGLIYDEKTRWINCTYYPPEETDEEKEARLDKECSEAF